MTFHTLKLRAKDSEDVQVISAVLQDSIVPVCDMAYRAEDKNFVLVAQRFCHEDDEQTHERICCAVNVHGIHAAQVSGIDLHHDERMLDLLMMSVDENALTLIFAGQAKIRLTLEADWSMIVEDFGEPWPSICKPCHEEANAST